MSDPDFNVCVIGGGVVGLAIARELVPRSGPLVLFERHDAWGRETSSRNSEVIHAGIYYAIGSLKARLCVEGRRLLYDFCCGHNVPHRNCGKIIIARTGEEEGELAKLLRRGAENEVEGLRLLSRAEVAALEPNVRAVAGLESPTPGILNAHGLMEAYAHDAASAGAELVLGAEILGLARRGDGWEVRYRDSSGDAAIVVRAVVNAAGHGAQGIMRLAGLDPDAMNLRLYLAKGDYFSVSGPKCRLISRLIYPPPREHLLSLGIHTVISLDGTFKLGPSAYYVDAIDYAVDPGHRKAFFDAVKTYLPFLEEEDLAPDMAGIRPKLAGPGEDARDFHIAHEVAAGAPGFFNLCGIESPGLTGSLAIGKMVGGMVATYLR